MANYQIWEGYPDRSSSVSYFDGSHAYYAPDYYHFYALAQWGDASEEWNNFGHGRTETAVLWQDKIIMDMQADYYYTAYPAQIAKPEPEQLIDMREKLIK